MAKSTTRNWLYALVYAIVLTAAIYLISDLEYPRMGFIRVDAADHFLVDLRANMQ
jgi:hypothetical protein